MTDQSMTQRNTVRTTSPVLLAVSPSDDLTLPAAVSKARKCDSGLCLAGVVTVSSLLGLMSLYYSEVLEHHVVLGSCVRPVVELLASLWSVALVSLACSSHGMDLGRILSGEPHPNLTIDLFIIAAVFTTLYLVSALLLQVNSDRGDDAEDWDSFSFYAFFSGLALIALPFPVLPMAKQRAAAMCTLGRTMAAGFFVVGFADVLTGDYLTSASKGLGDLVICPCTIDEQDREDIMDCVTALTTPIVCALPFMWRLLQCLRCYNDTKLRKHLANALKYTLGICVVWTSTLKRRELSMGTEAYYLFVASNSLYSFYWDVQMDWGVWYKNAQGSYVRRPTGFPGWVYPVAAALDFTLRISWSLKLVSNAITGESSVLLASSLELFRRTMWACLRVEYEQYVQSKSLEREQPKASDVLELTGLLSVDTEDDEPLKPDL